MNAGLVLAAAALLVWPAGAAVQRLRGLSPGGAPAAAGAVGAAGAAGARTGAGGLDAVRRIAERLPTPLALPLAAGLAGLVAFGPLHAGAAAVLVAATADLRARAGQRRRALAGLGAWERALDDASSALRAGAGPGVALRRAASAARSVEATDDGGAAPRVADSNGTTPGPRGVAAILTTAAAHADLGGDVAGALRPDRADVITGGPSAGLVSGAANTSARAGAGSAVDLIAGELAGAWLLATRHGVVLADVVDGLRADVASRRARAVRVDSTLAGPRATAVILTCLPVFGVLLGSGFGADPLRVLLQGTLGGALCLAGAVFLAAGLLWTDRIAGGALR